MSTHNIYFDKYTHSYLKAYLLSALARGYKTFIMLNSAEHDIYPAQKC